MTVREKTQKLLTISIAAYNVEKYLEQTLSSLNDERFLDEIEVLIIDDGSKDETKPIALKYQEMSPGTFHYVAKENGGHGSTINKGIELASGKYFRVLDGDDWVNTDAFARFISKLRNTDADMVLTQFKTNVDGKETVEQLVHGMEAGKLYSWSDGIDIHLITLHMLTMRTSLLKENDVKITEKCFYVDIEFDAWGIFLSRTIVFYEFPVYVYRCGHSEQSVNIKNLIKNLSMQENVSYKLAQLYECFTGSGELVERQKQALFQRISVSLYWTVKTYLMLPDAKDSKERIVRFERKIRGISSELYENLNSKRMFKALRLRNYAFIPLLRVAYRMQAYASQRKR